MKYEAHRWDDECWAIIINGDIDNPMAYCNTKDDAQQIADALNAPTVRIEVNNPHLQALAIAALAFAAAPEAWRVE